MGRSRPRWGPAGRLRQAARPRPVIGVDATSLLVIVAAAALAPVAVSVLGPRVANPAIVTLLPILTDAGEAHTRFGTYLLAAGASAEFGPILLVTLVLSTGHPLHEAAILVFFVALAVVAGVLAVRTAWRGWPLIERTFETSSQLAVRLAVVLVFGLVALATQLGLDLLLGGFVAGMITRLALRGHEVEVFDSKLTAVGYGFLIPFFFVTSGMAFNADVLFSDPVAFLKVPLFVGLFLIVRGVPALLLYRGVLPRRDRAAPGIFCATELPLVVAITTLALPVGDMHPTTAAALVGAAIISTLAFPLIGLWLRRDRPKEPEEPGHPATPPLPVSAEAGTP